MIQMKVIDTLDDLLQYKDKWESLLDINGLDIPFMELEWIVPWWKIMKENQELYIITFLQKGEPVGFCPLMKVKKRTYTEIQFIGYPETSYMDFLFEPSLREELNKRFLEEVALIKDAYIFNLHTFATRSENFHILQKHLCQNGKKFYTMTIDCPYIEIGEKNFEEYYKQKRKHTSIKRIKTAEKKIAEADGEIKYVNANSLRDSKGYMDKVFEIHDKRWAKKLDTSDFSSEKSKSFFTAIATNDNKRFKVLVDFLTLNDEIVAFEYGFVVGGTYVGYRACHDEDFSPLSLGKISLKENIKNIFESGLKEFNFGTGFERYKLEWTDNRGGLHKLLFSTDDTYSSKILSFVIMKEKFIRKIKSKPKIVNFKRNTLGKIKYNFSSDRIKALIKNVRGCFRLYTCKQIFKKACYRIIGSKYSQYDIYKVKKIKEIDYKYDESYSTTIATFTDIYSIADFANCSAEKIVNYMYKGNKCAIIRHGEKIVGCIWFSFNCENKKLKHQIDIIGRKVLFIKKIIMDKNHKVKDMQYLGFTYIYKYISKKDLYIGVRHKSIYNPNDTLKTVLIPQYCIKIRKVLNREKLTLGEV